MINSHLLWANFSLPFIAVVSLGIGAGVAFLSREIHFFSKSTDNQKIIIAASHFDEWEKPSDMHKFAAGKAHMKEFAVILLALVQKLIRDKKMLLHLVLLKPPVIFTPLCSKHPRMNRTPNLLYSPETQVRVAVEAGAGEVIEDRARLLEFLIGP